MDKRVALILVSFALVSLFVCVEAGLALQTQSVSDLIAQLSHQNPEVQGKAVDQLGELGDSSAVEPILRLLESPDRFLRYRCIVALEKLRDVRAIPRLIQLLDSSTEYSNSFSISMALGAMGADGVDLLIPALRSPSERVREGVASALGRIQDQRATLPLIDMLSDSSASVRSKAAAALGENGDMRAAAPLREALSDDSPEVRASVIRTLGMLKDTEAIPTIAALASNDASNVRAAAAAAMGEMASTDVVTPLIDALSDSDSFVRSRAARRLERFGEPRVVQALIGKLSDEVMTVRLDAAHSLGVIGDAAAMPHLVRLLETDSVPLVRDEAALAIAGQSAAGFDWLASASQSEIASIRGAAASGLSKFNDARSVALLGPLVRDADSSVRSMTIRALGSLTRTEAIPLLLFALTDPAEFNRGEAGNAIARFGKEAVPALIQALRDDDSIIRSGAERALAQIGSSALRPLIEALKDQNADVRASAASALRFATDQEVLDPAARDSLIQALNDADPRVRENVMTALGRSPGSDLVTHLMDRLRDRDARVRVTAIKNLLDAPATPPFQVFVDLLDDPDSKVRESAAEAVAKLGDESAIEPLSRALSAADPQVRYWAAHGLGKLGPLASAPLIRTLSNDDDWTVRAEAARGLGAMKRSEAIEPLISNLTSKYWDFPDTVAASLQSIGRPAVPALIKALEHRDPDVRELAAESLGAIADSAAVNDLVARLSDEDGFVRTAAAGALGRIGEMAAQPVLSAAEQTADSARRDAALWTLRFLEGGPERGAPREGFVEPSDVHNRLRNYYRASGSAPSYSRLAELCASTFCLQKYAWPSFPLLGLPADKPVQEASSLVIDQTGRIHQFDVNGNSLASTSGQVRRFEATLSIDAAGLVRSVTFDDSRLSNSEMHSVLRSWKFGGFKPGIVFPILHRMTVEFSVQGRPRYAYGRPWVEFGIDRIKITSHPGLPHIN